MPKFDDMYPSKYLKASDIPDEGMVLTIQHVEIEKMRDGKTVPVIYFDEVEKGMSCNKTNAKTITKLYGDDTDDWVDERITLFASECDYAGDTVPCIRIKPKKPKPSIQVTNTATGKTSKVTAPAAPPEDDGEDEDDTPF